MAVRCNICDEFLKKNAKYVYVVHIQDLYYEVCCLCHSLMDSKIKTIQDLINKNNDFIIKRKTKN